MNENIIANKPRRASTTAKQVRFLLILRHTLEIKSAARAANIGRQTVYDWLKDEAFNRQLRLVMHSVIQPLEDELTERAFSGTAMPIVYRGKQVGEVKEFSDKVLIELLKLKIPRRYNL